MIAKEFDVNANTRKRKHDGLTLARPLLRLGNKNKQAYFCNLALQAFFKYVYTVPKNAQALLNTLSRQSKDVHKILSNVDLGTLEEIPERYHNVDEYGEADIAFKAKTVSGECFYFGILNIRKRKSLVYHTNLFASNDAHVF